MDSTALSWPAKGMEGSIRSTELSTKANRMYRIIVNALLSRMGQRADPTKFSLNYQRLDIIFSIGSNATRLHRPCNGLPGVQRVRPGR